MGTLSAGYDWDAVYTIEFNGSKGWEVVKYFNSLSETLDWFRNEVANNNGQYRLTTPK